MAYLLAHDLGTTGNKAVLYSTDGVQAGSRTVGYETSYPRAHFVEQDAEAWWNAVCSATRQLLEASGVDAGEIAAVSFSAQMMGCLPVDSDGNPLRPCIIWADTRAGDQADGLDARLGNERVYEITGHRVSSSYSAAKIAWLKEHEPEVYRRMHRSLQVKDFIIYRLTGRFVTDYSDACGTNLFDIRERRWSLEIADALDIDVSLMPEAVASVEQVGTVTPEAAKATGLTAGTPVVAGGGDGACAATGATVTAPGSTYVIIGTSSWIATVSREPVFDPTMRTFNWIANDGELYSPCGTMQSAGFSYGWVRDLFAQVLERAAERGSGGRDAGGGAGGGSAGGASGAGGTGAAIDLDALLGELVDDAAPGAGGLLFLPYLMGERSPRWNPKARGAFVGMTAQTGTGALVRSVLEGVAYNLRTILNAFGETASTEEIVAIGGGAANERWLSILASAWNRRILVPEHLEDATSLGAAMCAGVSVGALDSLSSVSSFNAIRRTIEPDPKQVERYGRMHELFEKAYERLEPLFSELDEVD